MSFGNKYKYIMPNMTCIMPTKIKEIKANIMPLPLPKPSPIIKIIKAKATVNKLMVFKYFIIIVYLKLSEKNESLS